MESMRVKLTRNIYCLFVCLFLGCSYQQQVKLPPPNLPEKIYVDSKIKELKHSKVGVFRFSEPLYAPGTGKVAAESVYLELIKNSLFTHVRNEIHRSDFNIESVVRFARSEGYDIVIIGELIYYIDGFFFQPSRVEERIEAIHVPTNHVLWSCITVDVAAPASSTDFIFFVGRPAPPPPATLLLERNARKFVTLLADNSSSIFDNPTSNSASISP
jgi:hypothetical protein